MRVAAREEADPLGRLRAAWPASAAAFVVTLYGDVVAPRGGELWTGSIVETLAAVGIAETRVRTALSRLVAAGRLEGSKAGRRSYYRLTGAAAREFSAAARLIYGPVEPAPLRGWQLVLLPDATGATELARLRFGFPLPQVGVLPDRGGEVPEVPGCRFAAVHAAGELGAALAGAWPLAALRGRMEEFVARFSEIEAEGLTGGEALAVRLLLVHAFREIALRDPLLPDELLPGDWPGRTARGVFVRLYRACSGAADRFADAELRGREGPLRADRERLRRRLADMAGASR